MSPSPEVSPFFSSSDSEAGKPRKALSKKDKEIHTKQSKYLARKERENHLDANFARIYKAMLAQVHYADMMADVLKPPNICNQLMDMDMGNMLARLKADSNARKMAEVEAKAAAKGAARARIAAETEAAKAAAAALALEALEARAQAIRLGAM